MMDLATLDEVKAAQPPIEHDDDDDTLRLLISAASRTVMRYLGSKAQGLQLDQDGAEIPPELKVAAIITARHLYQQEGGEDLAHGKLPRRAEMLLYGFASITVV